MCFPFEQMCVYNVENKGIKIHIITENGFLSESHSTSFQKVCWKRIQNRVDFFLKS